MDFKTKGIIMAKEKQAHDWMNRRQFVKRAGVWGLAGVAAVYLPGCGKEEAEELAAKPHNTIQAAKEAADPCNDLSQLTPDEQVTRTTFKYQPVAKDPTKLCVTCNFWISDPKGGLCGACTLVKGPIHPKASCMSWAEKVRS
jgi:hypothetical protein